MCVAFGVLMALAIVVGVSTNPRVGVWVTGRMAVWKGWLEERERMREGRMMKEGGEA
jgi:hypothetical protein